VKTAAVVGLATMFAIGIPLAPNRTMNENAILKYIVAFFLPPLAVALEAGLGKSFVISLILTLLLFWLPGFIHALMVISNRKKAVA